MKFLAKISTFLIVLSFFALSACGKGPAPTTASSPNQAYTQIWETVAAGQTMTAAAATPTPQMTDTPQVSETPKPTNTPLVSATTSGDPTAASTDAAAPTATNTKIRSTAQATCDNFQFVSDVTYPDGAEVQAGTTIIKTWRIKNVGPCEWNVDYAIAFGWGGDGTDWNKSGAVGFPKTVKVGESVDLSMELNVPDEAGDYGGVFRVRNADDVYFGPTLTIYIVAK